MARRMVGAAVAVVAAVLVLVGVQGQVPRDPGTWMPAAPMSGVREGAASVLLPDGRVMVLGGRDANGALPTAEIYANGAWSVVPSPVMRWGHTATALADGRVLITGGDTPQLGLTSAVDIYDPVSNSLTPVGTLIRPRRGHAATRLNDEQGRVLIAGGFDGEAVVSLVEFFDPETLSLTPASFALSRARAGLTATTLLDGRVLVAGGTDGVEELAIAELVNLSTGFVFPRAMSQPRRDHSAVLLPNNNTVLLAGGVSGGHPAASAEVYVPWLDQFRETGPMAQARYFGTLAALSRESYGALAPGDGRALAAGGVELSASEVFSAAMIKTDKDDYAPGERVFLSGSGWEPGREITLALREVPAEHSSRTFVLTADETGRLVNEFLFDVEDHHLGVRFYLTARQTSDGVERQAQTTFTDGVTAVSITSPTTAAPATVTSLPGNVTIAFNYATNGSGGTIVAEAKVLSGSTVIASNSKTILRANSGSSENVVVSIPSGTVNGSYTVQATVSNPGGSGNPPSSTHEQTNAIVVSTSRPTVTALAVTTGSHPSTYGDSLIFTATVIATGGNPDNVGTVTVKNGAIVVCNSVALSGNTATCSPSLAVGSYTLTAEYSGTTIGSPQFQSSTSSELSHSVQQKNLTISGAVANNKPYNGTTAATVDFGGASLSGVVGSDNVTINSSGYSASFGDKHVDTGKAVTVTGVTLAGVQAGNYTVSQPNGLTANITPLGITGSFTAANKVYDGTPAATVTDGALSGAIAGDQVSLSGGTASFADKHVASGKTVTLSGATLAGDDAGNYTLSSVGTTTADITPKPLAVTGITANDKPYDGNATATLNLAGAALNGVVNPDMVTLNTLGATGTFVSGAVGTWTVQVAGLTMGGADVGNYALTQPTTTASILAWDAQGHGFYQPVGRANSVFVPAGMEPNNPAPTPNASTIWNVARGGSTVPLKFNVYANGVERTSTSDITGFTATTMAGCTTSPNIEDVEFYTTGSTTLRYSDGQFIQNWQTPKVNGDTCVRATVRFADGSTLSAFFRLRR